jgi:hypothetical protein
MHWSRTILALRHIVGGDPHAVEDVRVVRAIVRMARESALLDLGHCPHSQSRKGDHTSKGSACHVWDWEVGAVQWRMSANGS